MGDGYLRRFLVVGANAMLRMTRRRVGSAWILALLERKKPKTAVVALANKTAGISWALMAHGDIYKFAV